MATSVAIATWTFGELAAGTSGAVLSGGGTCLDAVEAGVRAVELDPSVHSVGYGGRPNSAGELELDAALMLGRTLDVGAVAALRGFRSVIGVARRVMTHSRHAFLVGEGAAQFALKHGFVHEPTLTDEVVREWQAWREGDAADGQSHDTVGVLALDETGALAAACATSGIRYKAPGRVGDSPLVGSGLYVDDRAGAAAATGLGEEILKHCLSFLVVELMRQGHTPEAACTQAIARLQARFSPDTMPQAAVIALAPDGRVGAATAKDVFPYAVWRNGTVTMHKA